jgi:hypothetical protein
MAARGGDFGKKKPHPKMGLKNSRGNLLQGGNSDKVEGGGTTLCVAFLEARYAQSAFV